MSSYVKAMEAVMRFFPKKINVTFNHVKGYQIGVCKIYEEQLPNKFKRPIILEAFDRKWRVLKADPLENKDFVYSRKLTLVVVEPEEARHIIPQYFNPTISGSMPELEENIPNNDFIIDIADEDWRQVELLPSSLLPQVSEELSGIQLIRKPGKDIDVLSGYEKMHVRQKISGQNNNIRLDEFCKVLDRWKLGAIRFMSSGFVKDGFALQSDGYTYYGRMVDNVIKDLCIYKFDCADYELLTILSTFDLVMANWCDGKIMTAEVKVVDEQDLIQGKGNDMIADM